MATLKQRLHRKNASGTFDTIHLETSSDLVLRPSGNTVEQDLVDQNNEINSLKTSVSSGKAAIASAVTDKGVQTAADATFQTIASNIGKIGTAPRYMFPGWYHIDTTYIDRAEPSESYDISFRFSIPAALDVTIDSKISLFISDNAARIDPAGNSGYGGYNEAFMHWASNLGKFIEVGSSVVRVRETYYNFSSYTSYDVNLRLDIGEVKFASLSSGTGIIDIRGATWKDTAYNIDFTFSTLLYVY